MNDYLGTLLTSMSSKFNEPTSEMVDVNLNEDKTMKWRGLLNNKYASGGANRRKETSASGGKAADSIDAIANVSTSAAAASAEAPLENLPAEQVNKIDDELKTEVKSEENSNDGKFDAELKAEISEKDKSIVDETKPTNDDENVEKLKDNNKPKRVLRHKQAIDVIEKKVNLIKEKKIDTAAIAGQMKKRRGRTKKLKETISANTSHNFEIESTNPKISETLSAPTEMSTNVVVVDPPESNKKPTETSIIIQLSDERQPEIRLRRSERTQPISTQQDDECAKNLTEPTKDDLTLSKKPRKLESESKPSTAECLTADNLNLSKRKRKTTETSIGDNVPLANPLQMVEVKLEETEETKSPSLVQDANQNIANEIIEKEVKDETSEPTKSADPQTAEQLPVQQTEPNQPKKRGRKPGTKLKPKPNFIVQETVATGIATEQNKRHLRKSKETMTSAETILATAIARKEKNNEQAIPQQRLSRRIKPTAKILANEELRYGFELQNNARLSLSSEHLDKELDRSPKEEKPSCLTELLGIPNDTNHLIVPSSTALISQTNMVAINISPSQMQQSKIQIISNTEVKIENEQIEEKPIITVEPPKRRPCPDPQKFLNEIKLAKINLNRSPEDNKKLNIKQKRRLIKLKEKHFNKLGLQKASKSNSGESSADLSESDDLEEFVPNKKICVSSRPSGTLRVRCAPLPDNVVTAKLTKPKELNKKHIISKPSEMLDKSKDQTYRSHENSLLLSTKHKLTEDRVVEETEDYQIDVSFEPIRKEIKQEIDLPTICLCTKGTKYYTQKTVDTKFCRAIDEIEKHRIGCSNEVEGDILKLYRSGVRVPYQILCKNHQQRLLAHNSCAGCGVFCTQGKFLLCSRNHFFHRNCATKFILNAPFNHPQNSDYKCPTLVLKCPHCGVDAPAVESIITMKCTSSPVFLPNLYAKFGKKAKMSIGMYGSGGGITSDAKKHAFLLEIDKLIPQSVVEVITKAQNNFPFSRSSYHSTKDLFCAINSNDVHRVAEIIVSGFDITTPLNEFQNGTCLHLVANFGTIKMAYLILSRTTSIDFINCLDKELRTAIMCAVVGEKSDILKLLVQCGADVTQKGPDGMTALHLAAKIGNLTAAQTILDNYREGASIYKLELFLNAIDDGGWTAIVWAAENGHADMVGYFINCGANVNICDSENNTALHWATMSNSIETIVPLLQSDCDFNAQNINGDTPLHFSCRNSNTKMALLLLTHGANLDVKNCSGESPYDCISDETSECAKAIEFNLKIRKIGRFSERFVVCQDISNGRECYPIKVVQNIKFHHENSVDNDLGNDYTDDDDDEVDELPDFKYITKTILLQNSIQIDRRISQMRICSCSDNCTSQNCQCSEISVQNWYNSEGRLNGNFNYKDPAMIFECNDVCGCNKLLCKNRVVQNGFKVALQIIKCSNKIKGWGVIGLSKILQGTFVAEYTGEILTDVEADRRTDDSYFFDLGASEHCIDANYYGNVSRFFNHSCEPTVVPIRVYFEHQDLRFPKIAFFASRDIEAGDEITFDYGDKFWMIKSKSFTCQCGFRTCRYTNRTFNKTLNATTTSTITTITTNFTTTTTANNQRASNN